MIEKSNVDLLLSDLCVRLGFCLSASERERLMETPPETPHDFTRALFEAEGLSPELADRSLHGLVLQAVTQAYSA